MAGPLTPWLESKQGPDGQVVFTLYGSLVSFSCYFAMYAFRRPFTAANYEGLFWNGTQLDLKTALVLAQLLGYMTSKWIGIKYVSEAIRGRVWLHLMGMITVAQFTLLLFAVLPTNWKPVAMFLNGLPLGVIWGLVVSYLEGRSTSDFMMTGLCTSFIIASGVVKDAALIAMGMGFDQFWAPAAVGAAFYPIFGLCVWLLNQLPKPTEAEKVEKTERPAMTTQDQIDFVKYLWPGLVVLWFGVMCLTAYRDYRDTFSAELLKDLGIDLVPGAFSSVETVVGFSILIPVALLGLIKSNRNASMASFLYLLLGSILIFTSCSLLSAGGLDGYTYMVLTGIGSYLSYVPYNSVLFERIIGYTSAPSTVSFPMQVSDSLGYFGVLGIYLFNTFGDKPSDDEVFLQFFQPMGYILSVACAVSYGFGFVYFFVIFPRRKNLEEDGSAEKQGDAEMMAAPLQAS